MTFVQAIRLGRLLFCRLIFLNISLFLYLRVYIDELINEYRYNIKSSIDIDQSIKPNMLISIYHQNMNNFADSGAQIH